MTERPHTPYNERLFAAAMESMRGRPPAAEMIINHHITMVGVGRLQSPGEVVFGPKTTQRSPLTASIDLRTRLQIAR